MLSKKKRIPVLEILLYGLWPSFIKKMLFQLKGYKIGKRVKFCFGSIIIGKHVKISDHVEIGLFTILIANEIQIGRFTSIGAFSYLNTNRIQIGEDTRIREQVFVGGLSTPDSCLVIGSRCLIMQMCYLNPTCPIFIDDDTALGGHTLLFTHSSWLSVLDGYPANFGAISIGSKVWIPWRTLILSGVTIGNNVIIHPNAVINSNVPSNSIATGNPLKVYPNLLFNPLNREAQIEQLHLIFKEFMRFMQFNGFFSSIESNDGYHIITVNREKVQNVIFIYNSKNRIKTLNYDIYIFFDDPDESWTKELMKASMTLIIQSKKRMGSCDLGEELARFFSRYGIRFERAN